MRGRKPTPTPSLASGLGYWKTEPPLGVGVGCLAISADISSTLMVTTTVVRAREIEYHWNLVCILMGDGLGDDDWDCFWGSGFPCAPDDE